MSATRKVRPDTSGPREADYYPTPAWAVEAVADLILASRPKDMPVIYEPGAGEGAILRVLKARGADARHIGCHVAATSGSAARFAQSSKKRSTSASGPCTQVPPDATMSDQPSANGPTLTS